MVKIRNRNCRHHPDGSNYHQHSAATATRGFDYGSFRDIKDEHPLDLAGAFFLG